jgi:polysaccharide export outer membrane protein
MDELQNHQIKKFDKIIVREKVDYFTERLVRVDGFVNYPGYHKIVKGKTKLSEMILNSAGGFREEASLKDAYVIRTIGSDEIDAEFERLKTIPIADMTEDEYDYFKARSREEKGRIVLNFSKLFLENDYKEDLILKRGDVIYIPEAKDYVTLVGQVVRPGNLIYKENLSVDDYINLAGGFAWRAIEDDVRVIKSESGEWIEADEVESLSPGDIIWIPEDPPAPPFWETFKDVLSITGQLATVITAIVAIIVASR